MAVTDSAILRIREMILTGELAPGMRLPPEKELSERLGLSRSSMREAVKALEVIRVLDVRQGDGTYVTSLEPRLLLEALTFVIDLHSDDSILEMFAVRRILEAEATAMAAGRIDEATIARLRELTSSVDETTDIEGLVAHDLEFHGAIVAAAGNGYLANLLESLSSNTVRARIWRGLTQENAVSRTLAEHESLVAALERGDARLAASLAHVHIAGVEQWLAAWADDDVTAATD
jgi:GntR family transcriptional repressor for pyruvate dehydrogenase complex